MEGALRPAPQGAGLCASDQSDHAWALKRDWTDVEFQEGAEANRAQLQAFEDTLVARLQRSSARAASAEAAAVPDAAGGAVGRDMLARMLDPVAANPEGLPERVRMAVLDDPEVLGSALDIVGAYLKNYEVDKANAVIGSVMQVCRKRGGLWLLKALNHQSTVRMKQARPAEALQLLEEMDAYAAASLDPRDRDEAWEFWETVYRNFGWALSNLGREAEAIAYIERAIDVKERVGRCASWFDLWDLGRMKATSALRSNEAKVIQASQAAVTKALWLHRDAEPADLVMRAKIWHTVGECSFALGHLDERESLGERALGENPNAPAKSSGAQAHYRKALKCFRESHKLFRKTEGQHNPLTGAEAQAVAWTLLKLGEYEDAKAFLLDALETASRQQSGWGDASRADHDAPALGNAMQAVDRVLEAHRRTGDREGLTRYFDAIERLCANVCGRVKLSKERSDAAVYEKLVSSCSMVMVASGDPDGMSRSQKLLSTYLWDRPNTPQAQICSEMLRSLRNGETAEARGSMDLASSPGMAALVDALAKSGMAPP